MSQEIIPDRQHASVFVVIDLGSWYEVRPIIERLFRHLDMKEALEIRQYVERQDANDRRAPQSRKLGVKQRREDRRGCSPVLDMTYCEEAVSVLTACTRRHQSAEDAPLKNDIRVSLLPE